MHIFTPVADWRECRRWYCMHTQTVGFVFTSIASAAALAGAAAPWFTVFDFGIAFAIAAVIFAAGLIGRLVDQKPRDLRAAPPGDAHDP